MELLSSSPSTTFTIVVLVIVAGLGLLSVLLSAWSLQLANSFCGGDEAGLLRCSLGVFVSTFLSTAFVLLATYIEPEASQWAMFGYGLFGAVLGVSLVLFQNPLRAVGTYLMYCIIGTLLHLVVMLMLAVGAYFAVPKQFWNDLGKQAVAMSPKTNPEVQKKLEQWMAQNKTKEQQWNGEVSVVDLEAVKVLSGDAEEVSVPGKTAQPLPPKSPQVLPPNVTANPFVK